MSAPTIDASAQHGRVVLEYQDGPVVTHLPLSPRDAYRLGTYIEHAVCLALDEYEGPYTEVPTADQDAIQTLGEVPVPKEGPNVGVPERVGYALLKNRSMPYGHEIRVALVPLDRAVVARMDLDTAWYLVTALNRAAVVAHESTNDEDGVPT